MSAPLVFLDIETTGLHADRRPWEIAMIRREGNRQREITIYVSDVDLANAELIGLNIGRFYQRHPLCLKEVGGTFDPRTEADQLVDPADADQLLGTDECLYPESRVAKIVERWTRGAHIVGSVPNFDTETLAAMLRRHGLCPAWHYHLIDVENLAVGWLHATEAANARLLREVKPDVQFIPSATELPWKSDDLSRAVGVEPPSEYERHTAMGDAQWAMRVYDQITGGTA